MLWAPRAGPAKAQLCDLTTTGKGCSLTIPTAQELTVMAFESRIRELNLRHQSLERAIEDEASRPAADAARLRELKRKKLRLKEEMEGLRARPH